ncbi:MAG: methionyl-tRNA formyltransferase, partial [Acidobacteriaceae bacterium]|nr:methionyl-tRNA formyltransferase [Acidobacteriaceae bacterium]
IIPQAIIDIPRLGVINVHASLLPKYRGAAPIQWAVARGEAVTGVTTMRIDAGLDTGDMLLKWSTGIGAEETALELSPRLAEAGADLLIETLAGLEAGRIHPEPQNPQEATLAPILKKEDGLIDWQWPAHRIFNRGRGFLPWPGVYTHFRGQLFHLWRSRPVESTGNSPGRIRVEHKRLFVECGEQTCLELLDVQLEGRKRLSAAMFMNGVRLAENECLGARIH